MEISQAQIKELEKFFKDKPVNKAYIFGSQATGMADSQSDIDILVDLDYSQKIGLGFIKMKLDLESILGTEVDLISSGGVSKFIRKRVEKEKRLIYAR